MGRAPTPRFSEGMRNRRLSVDRVQRTRSSFAAIAILACPTMVVLSFAPITFASAEIVEQALQFAGYYKGPR